MTAPAIVAKTIGVSRSAAENPWRSNPAYVELEDIVPDAFSFAAEPQADLNAVVVSASIVVAGITAASPISVSGDGSPEYRLDGGSWTASSGTVTVGQTVEVRLTASGSASVTRLATLTIGGISAVFSVTTVPGPPAVMAADTGTTCASHPSLLDGFNYIRIFETHQNIPAGIITFTLDANATIYYAHDDTNNIKPPFLTGGNGWTDSTETITFSDGITRELWQKSVTSGAAQAITWAAASHAERGAYKIGPFFIPSGVALSARTPLSYELCSLDNYAGAPSDKFLWDDPPDTDALTATQSVSSLGALNTAISSALPGSVIKLANGTYTGSTITISGKSGTQANPIIICPATRGLGKFGAGVSVRFINSHYIIFTGFEFLTTCTVNNKITRDSACTWIRTVGNKFSACNSAGSSFDNWDLIEGDYCRSDHNTYSGKTSRGNCIRVPPNSASVRPFGGRTDHNLCEDMVSFDGDSEAWQLGGNLDHTAEILHLHEHNETVNFNGSNDDEIITIKAETITLWANRYIDCSGAVTLRRCRHVLALAEVFSGSVQGGYRIHGNEAGGDHVVALPYFDSVNSADASGRACFVFSQYNGTTYYNPDNTLITGARGRNTGRFVTFQTARTTDPSGIRFEGNAALCATNAMADSITAAAGQTYSGNVWGPANGITTPTGVTVATLTFADGDADEIYTTSHASIDAGVNTQFPAAVEPGLSLGAAVGVDW